MPNSPSATPARSRAILTLAALGLALTGCSSGSIGSLAPSPASPGGIMGPPATRSMVSNRPFGSGVHYLYSASVGNDTVNAYQLPLTDNSIVVGSLDQFEAPTDVVANAKYMFIDDPGENTIHAYTQPITSSTHKCDFGDDNILDSQALAENGDYLYVLEGDNDLLEQFVENAHGKPCTTSPVSTTSTGNLPLGIAVNTSFIYVSNYEDNTIDEYAQGAPFADGELPLATLSGVSPDGGGPQVLALDSDHLYVANYAVKSSVLEYKLPLSSSSGPKLSIALPSPCGSAPEPTGLAVDDVDSPKMLYVADDVCGMIYGYTTPLTKNQSPSVSLPASSVTGMSVF